MERQNCECKLCYKSVLPSGQHHPSQELKSLLLSWQEQVHSLNFSLESPGTFGYLCSNFNKPPGLALKISSATANKLSYTWRRVLNTHLDTNLEYRKNLD
ncbi:hypothetical protein AV530_013099 [Patagioenas fasciata monilis]|uniref:Uncharacterized protein n=1 Tax=Patagioenas fasciata monilis TaxID=372326 RepID=A0A1V4JAI5_PATFA|nr:hypothetical protein AV530_013099 [Patagioenas fasciata monilis]